MTLAHHTRPAKQRIGWLAVQPASGYRFEPEAEPPVPSSPPIQGIGDGCVP